MITILSGNHLSALTVLALIWLILSISYMISAATDVEKSFKEGIRLSLWVVGSVLSIYSVIVYNSQFH